MKFNPDKFSFVVLPHGRQPPNEARGRAYLLTDNWDDWFKFNTQYYLTLFDDDGEGHDIGHIKVGQFGLTPKKRRPDLPKKFTALDETFFSLGQDDSYYVSVAKLGDEWRRHLLRSLRDVAADLDLFRSATDEEVMATSLLRSVSPETVRGQFHRLAHGGARLSAYKFSYRAPKQVAVSASPLKVTFEVRPEAQPPTNIHVLIGRNGVGKTYLLDLMTRALIKPEDSSRKVGKFSFSDTEDQDQKFANVVSVSFSAFDHLEPVVPKEDKSTDIPYVYVGIKTRSKSDPEQYVPKSHRVLAGEFVDSMRACSHGARLDRWRRALEILEADPVFKEADVSQFAELVGSENYKTEARAFFDRKLSSGHKIVLLTMTKLVESVAERSLVLLDEPEAHLHPPLLSAFIRALSDLLMNRNGVAIVSTHSPVILQEVPKNCVWKLTRSGHQVSAERPEIETFGENVGVLTREVFRLEVTYSGFHKIIEDVANSDKEFSEALEDFGGQLGAEGRAILRALISERNSKKRDE